MPLEFYEDVSNYIKAFNCTGFKIRQCIQTNGLLLNEKWCGFIKRQDIDLGISIDGPEFLHDINRRTYSEKGTHAEVMRSVKLLQREQVSFHAIAVITKETLDYPEKFYQFFLENHFSRVALNVEEIEGENEQSSLAILDIKEKFTNFMTKLYGLYFPNRHRLSIREFDSIAKCVKMGGIKSDLNQQTTPFRILSVDCDGNYTTFSPELLGMNAKQYQTFKLGNILTDRVFPNVESDVFKNIYKDILRGIFVCKSNCKYFSVCGGGAPSNKFSENGTFNSRETLYCQLKIQSTFDAVASSLLAAMPE